MARSQKVGILAPAALQALLLAGLALFADALLLERAGEEAAPPEDTPTALAARVMELKVNRAKRYAKMLARKQKLGGVNRDLRASPLVSKRASAEEERALIGWQVKDEALRRNTTDQSVLAQVAWDEREAEEEGRRLKIFCFAWTPRRPEDNAMLPSVRRQLEACDGHLFFTDNWTVEEDNGSANHAFFIDPDSSPAPAPGARDEDVLAAKDVVRVPVPPQELPRNGPFLPGKGWLRAKNMAGLLPVWDHLLANKVEEGYDWIINVEIDQFVRPSRVRTTIAEYVQMLRKGDDIEKEWAEGPLMLAFGNAFAFNRKLTQALREDWDAVSARHPDGCPVLSKRCEQDMSYHFLVAALPVDAGVVGARGCGAFARTRGKDKVYPLACWDMHQSPSGHLFMSELDETLRMIPKQPLFMTPYRVAGLEFNNVQAPLMTTHGAMLKGMTRVLAEDVDDSQDLERDSLGWFGYFAPRSIPIIHHIPSSDLHDVAHELLGV